ncbi:hypothetical protein VWN77_11055, partial [Campylobacter coli]
FVNINETIEQTEEENSKSLDELLAEQAKFDVYTDILKKLVAKEATAQRNEDSFAFKLSNGKMYNFENGQTLFIGNFDKLIV